VAEIGSNLGVKKETIVATQLEFSTDGKNLLVTTASEAHYVVDAYDATTRFRLVGHYSYTNEPFQSGGEASWTPDGKYIVSGSKDGGVYVWDIAKAIADQQANINNPQGMGSSYLNGGGNNNGSSTSLLSANGELKPFKVLKAHGTPSHIVAFNPKYLMMVSGSTELVRSCACCFWNGIRSR